MDKGNEKEENESNDFLAMMDLIGGAGQEMELPPDSSDEELESVKMEIKSEISAEDQETLAKVSE